MQRRTDGEAIANDTMAAWSSGTTEDFADIYAHAVVLTTTDDADVDREDREQHVIWQSP